MVSRVDLDKIVVFIEKLKHERDEEKSATLNYRAMAREAAQIHLSGTARLLFRIADQEANHAMQLQKAIDNIVKKYSL